MSIYKTTFNFLICSSALFIASVTQASIIKIDESAFKPNAGLITFSEFDINTSDPFYSPSDYGGSANSPFVSFGGFFLGQRLGTSSECPLGSVLTGCVVGLPKDTLALDLTSSVTRIVRDGSNPTSPVLSGSPIFNGPISILFSIDIAGVGLDGGFFDAIGGTAITAFDRSGNIIGTVKNEKLGIEFLGLITSNSQNKIAGLQFHLVGAEPAGFGIDNLRFGTSEQIIDPNPVSTPTSIMLFSMSLVALGLRKKMPSLISQNGQRTD